MAEARLSVSIGGREFQDWKKIQVQSSVESCAAAFSFSCPLEALRSSLRFRHGAHVKVEVLSQDEPGHSSEASEALSSMRFRERLFTGFVEKIETAIGDSGGTAQVSGRSLSGLFVQSAADSASGEWNNATVYEVAEALGRALAPDGSPAIRREMQPLRSGETRQPSYRFTKFTTQPGESIWAAVERACRFAGLLAYPSTYGDLLISPPANDLLGSARRVALLEGRNVLKASLLRDYSERHRRYIVRGQRPGTDESYGEEAAAVEGVSEDIALRHTDESGRQLNLVTTKIIVAEGAVDVHLASRRAAWEKSVRLARTDELTVNLAHLLIDPDSAASGPWLVNRLFHVDLNSLGVRSVHLVKSVDYQVDRDSGTQVQLGLVSPSSYSQQPSGGGSASTDSRDLLEEEEEEDLL